MTSEQAIAEAQLRNAIRNRDQTQLVEAVQALVDDGSDYLDVYRRGPLKEGLTVSEWHKLLDGERIELNLEWRIAR